MHNGENLVVRRLLAVGFGVGLALAAAGACAAPSATSTGQADVEGAASARVVLEVLPTGNVTTPEGPIPLEELPTYLEDLLGATPDMVVAVRASAEPAFDQVAEVLRQLRPLRERGLLLPSQLDVLGISAMTLPDRVAPAKAPSDAAYVAVSEKGEIRASDGSHPSVVIDGLEELQRFAAAIVAGAPGTAFVLKLDSGVPARKVQSLLEALKGGGAAEVLLLVRDPEATTSKSGP